VLKTLAGELCVPVMDDDVVHTRRRRVMSGTVEMMRKVKRMTWNWWEV